VFLGVPGSCTSLQCDLGRLRTSCEFSGTFAIIKYYLQGSLNVKVFLEVRRTFREIQ
jgi:hypothetical protein